MSPPCFFGKFFANLQYLRRVLEFRASVSTGKNQAKKRGGEKHAESHNSCPAGDWNRILCRTNGQRDKKERKSAIKFGRLSWKLVARKNGFGGK